MDDFEITSWSEKPVNEIIDTIEDPETDRRVANFAVALIENMKVQNEHKGDLKRALAAFISRTVSSGEETDHIALRCAMRRYINLQGGRRIQRDGEALPRIAGGADGKPVRIVGYVCEFSSDSNSIDSNKFFTGPD